MRTIFTTAMLLVFSLTVTAQTGNDSITVTESVAYRADVGSSTVLDLAQPLFGSQQNCPAILIVHGGGWNSGSKNDSVYRALMIDYAMQGYGVAYDKQLEVTHPAMNQFFAQRFRSRGDKL